jgi:NADPH:quinone reductase-like Zn-dependent oxidoreductase
VLVWGASGGLGSMAVQLIACRRVVSDDEEAGLRHVARRQVDQPQ